MSAKITGTEARAAFERGCVMSDDLGHHQLAYRRMEGCGPHDAFEYAVYKDSVLVTEWKPSPMSMDQALERVWTIIRDPFATILSAADGVTAEQARKARCVLTSCGDTYARYTQRFGEAQATLDAHIDQSEAARIALTAENERLRAEVAELKKRDPERKCGECEQPLSAHYDCDGFPLPDASQARCSSITGEQTFKEPTP